MRYLRSNTATRITVGPFFDKTDGVTPETGITVTSEKLTLMVDTGGVPTLVLDAAPTASGGANDMVHVTNDDAGFYDLELAAADVNYVGRAMLALTDATVHCPVFHELFILPAAIYDWLTAGVAPATQTSVDDLPTNAELATALGTADDAVLTAIADLPTNSELATALGTADDAVLTAIADLPTNAELATALGTADDAVLAAVADLPTNAELATALAAADDAVLAQVALVKAKTDSLTFTVAGVVDANIQRVRDIAVDGVGSEADPWGPV